MLREIYDRRALIWAFANRDFSTRYRASAFGWGWSLLQPLAQLLVFAAVFSLIFRIQPPTMGNGKENFAVFLFTGMVTWNLFSGILNLSMLQLKSTGDLLKKVSFPAWTPVLGATIVQLVQVALELVVLIAMYLVFGNIGITWLLAIPILLSTALFAQGIGLMLAILNAHYGDVQYFVTVLLGALYFLTPILYPMSFVESASPAFATVINFNPMAWYVQSMQDVMYALVSPPPMQLIGIFLGGFITFLVGLKVFNRYSRDIAEVL